MEELCRQKDITSLSPFYLDLQDEVLRIQVWWETGVRTELLPSALIAHVAFPPVISLLPATWCNRLAQLAAPHHLPSCCCLPPSLTPCRR